MQSGQRYNCLAGLINHSGFAMGLYREVCNDNIWLLEFDCVLPAMIEGNLMEGRGKLRAISFLSYGSR